MANETTYALVSSFLPAVWETALMYVQENFFMPSIVRSFTNLRGMQDRKFTEYQGGTVATGLAETDDLSTQAFNRALLATLTPGEVGTQYFVTDRRMDSDDVDVMADLAEHIGYTVGKQVEQDLISDFANFTGGTVGTAGSALTWATVYAGRARLAASAVPGPYNVVLHEYAWYDLAIASNIAAQSNASPLRIRDEIQSRYYVGSVGDMDFYVTGDEAIAAGTAITQGIFARPALGFDVRRALRLEPERDASRRGTEVNATMIYAHGVIRPLWGIKLLSDASAPS